MVDFSSLFLPLTCFCFCYQQLARRLHSVFSIWQNMQHHDLHKSHPLLPLPLLQTKTLGMGQIWSSISWVFMTASKKMSWYESAKHAFLKVVKWNWKEWKCPFLMQIYVKQCEIMQKNQWKGPNFQIQCSYNERSLTDRSSLLKTGKTRETKT